MTVNGNTHTHTHTTHTTTAITAHQPTHMYLPYVSLNQTSNKTTTSAHQALIMETYHGGCFLCSMLPADQNCTKVSQQSCIVPLVQRQNLILYQRRKELSRKFSLETVTSMDNSRLLRFALPLGDTTSNASPVLTFLEECRT